MIIDVFYVAIIVNWTWSVDAFLNFLIFHKKPEARTGTEPVVEIRGGLHD